ncbi:acetamidase/formamidase family protein [Egicoccus halophilus]|uniref:Acetamidase n=1 Tax=Egicoccus halophilus TaxID=1670830 RepID=A0A8J3EV44_9ACTN|nr:acetamidase/formamidase family protein [Egicoccus halophilus]GGI08440.1 acetamidase [Egicoccus halophilus]
MHRLHHRDGHTGWDRRRAPRRHVDPGDTVELVLADCFGGQLGPDATADAIAALDLARANPLTGPVAVPSAAPGDTLTVEVLAIETGPVGWTALIPGFGLLADEFPDPHVVVSSLTDGTVDFGGFARLPARPFLGTVGLAPAATGEHSVIPPRRVGGNLDCRDVRVGATLLLPVEVPHALLSVGDPHAAQGDGEVCGTAVETSATATVRIGLRRGGDLPAPQLELPAGASSPHGPRLVTTGVGPDLYAAARDATRAMVDRLGTDHGLAPVDAYALCSVAADLRIVEVVDAPNWVVALDLDLTVLR